MPAEAACTRTSSFVDVRTDASSVTPLPPCQRNIVRQLLAVIITL
jgi:hypothetical protein